MAKSHRRSARRSARRSGRRTARKSKKVTTPWDTLPGVVTLGGN